MTSDPSGQAVILVGGALPPGVVQSNALVSAAAAKWQLAFVAALSTEWGSKASCLSYVSLGPSESATGALRVGPGIEILPIVRRKRLGGTLAYCLRMLREVWRHRSGRKIVFAYNPLIWTAPWAWLIAKSSGSPMVLIVADFEIPVKRGGVKNFRALIERALLLLTERYILLSPASRRLLGASAKCVVLNGTADCVALQCEAPRYGGTVRFVYAGSLVEGAGIAAFLEAAALLADEHADCEFHVFGRGPFNVSSSGLLESKLHVHGFVCEEELNEFLGRDSVGVNPRLASEPGNEFNAPYKVLYYLSRGVATLSTRTSGLPRDLEEACLMATPGAEGIAEAMRKVLRMTGEELNEIARRGRHVVRTTRSGPAMARLVEALLDSPPGKGHG